MKSTGKSTERIFLDTIREQLKCCPRPVRVVCALSGGPDSAVLLLLLSKHADSLKIIPEAAYMNHGIRDLEVLADEDRRVAGLCDTLDIPLSTKHLSPGFLTWYAARKGIGTEAAAREYRYHFLDEVVNRGGTQSRLALGHNRNDQEETMLMRLFSGAGLQGLQGIPRHSDRLIRPLIDLDRALIEQYLREMGLEAVEDESNGGDDYLRNRVRNRVLPYIRDFFPGAGDSLRSLAASMNEVLGHYRSLLDSQCPWTFEDRRFSCREKDFLALPSVSRRMVLLNKRNLLLKGREGAQRIPSSFLNPLDEIKGSRLLNGYGISFYREKDRFILEARRIGEDDRSLFYHLNEDYPYVSDSYSIRLEEGFSSESGSPEDLVCPSGGEGSLYVLREEGRANDPVLYCGIRPLLCLTESGPAPLKGIKIEKRSDSDGFRGLQCVIIKYRG